MIKKSDARSHIERRGMRSPTDPKHTWQSAWRQSGRQKESRSSSFLLCCRRARQIEFNITPARPSSRVYCDVHLRVPNGPSHFHRCSQRGQPHCGFPPQCRMNKETAVRRNDNYHWNSLLLLLLIQKHEFSYLDDECANCKNSCLCI
jgi:hypothetical protein